MPKIELGQEYLAKNEAAAIARIVDSHMAVMQVTPNDPKRRAGHPKGHGICTLKFEVFNDIPTWAKKGIFAQGTTYDGIVRFSNSLGESDLEDAISCALKLFGVEGHKMWGDDPVAKTADLILTCAETWFCTDANEAALTFETLFRLVGEGNQGATLFEKLAKVVPDVVPRLGGLFGGSPKSLLNANYYSAVPYALGSNNACKYQMRPIAENLKHQPSNTSAPNFLQNDLATFLKTKTATWEFLVQPQEDANTNPVENPTIAWKSKPVPIAKISLSPQKPDNTSSEAERLAFNPWRVPEENRPLGSVNRARLEMYKSSAAKRRTENKVGATEPANWPNQSL